MGRCSTRDFKVFVAGLVCTLGVMLCGVLVGYISRRAEWGRVITRSNEIMRKHGFVEVEGEWVKEQVEEGD